MAQQPPSVPRPSHYRGFMVTLRHTTVGMTPLDEQSARRRDLYLTTNNTHNRQTYTPPGGIRTHNPSKRAAADPPLRPRGHCDRRKYITMRFLGNNNLKAQVRTKCECSVLFLIPPFYCAPCTVGVLWCLRAYRMINKSSARGFIIHFNVSS